MSNYRQDPFINLDGIQKIQQELGKGLGKELEKIFEGDWIKTSSRYAGSGDWVPDTDTVETDSHWQFIVDLPGVSLADIDVSVLRDEIRIKGNKRNDYSGTAVSSERRVGEFERVLALPDDVDESTLNASMQNGVLSLTVDKSQVSSARSIPVKDAN